MINYRKGLITIQLLLAILASTFASVCVARPAAPQISIETVIVDGADNIRLYWNPIETLGEGITEYILDESIGTLKNQRYYRVTTEIPLPDWLIVADGSLLNGITTIDPFHIGNYQVTQEEWIAVRGNNPARFTDENGVPNKIKIFL